MFLNEKVSFMENIINVILINFLNVNGLRMKIMQPRAEYINLFFVYLPEMEIK